MLPSNEARLKEAELGLPAAPYKGSLVFSTGKYHK